MKNKQSPNVQQSIEALAMKEYPVLNDREKVWGNDIVTDLNLGGRHAFTKGHSLGRTTTIQEIEDWAKFHNYGQERIIFLKDLLEYIKTLKP